MTKIFEVSEDLMRTMLAKEPGASFFYETPDKIEIYLPMSPVLSLIHI